MDRKAIESFAAGKKKSEELDGQKDTDADYGKKKYSVVNEQGKALEKIVEWFGYKLHLVVDAT